MPDDPKAVHKNGDIDMFNKYKDNTNWDNFFAITPRGENEVWVKFCVEMIESAVLL